MDPLRALIHLGLKTTEATLDRTLDVVRLVDTLLVATAVPTERPASSGEPVWPEEEQADLDALSATLRARDEDATAVVETPPAKKSTATKAPAKKAAAKKSTATKAPAKKAAAKKSTATKAPAKKAAAKKSTATKAPAKKAAAKKSTATKAPAKKTPASATGGNETGRADV